MAINFPPSPSVGDLWPAPPATPRWRFSGIAWLPAPVVVPPDQSVTGNLSVADDVDIGGNLMVAGDLRADGDVQFDTIRVINQATFNDGVEIDGVDAADLATKLYVDEAVASGGLWQGAWDPETNTPDLTNTAIQLNGWTWAVTLTDITAPFEIPATPALPGLNGVTVYNGDHVIWSTAQSAFQVVHGSSLSLAEARDMFLALEGGTLTNPGNLTIDGDLTVAGNATATVLGAANQWRTAVVGLVPLRVDTAQYGHDFVITVASLATTNYYNFDLEIFANPYGKAVKRFWLRTNPGVADFATLWTKALWADDGVDSRLSIGEPYWDAGPPDTIRIPILHKSGNNTFTARVTRYGTTAALTDTSVFSIGAQLTAPAIFPKPLTEQMLDVFPLSATMRRGTPGSYTQGTDFTDLQTFLDANINNRMFNASVRIEVNAANTTPVTLGNVQFSVYNNNAVTFTIIATAQLADVLQIVNVHGVEIVLQGMGAITVYNSAQIITSVVRLQGDGATFGATQNLHPSSVILGGTVAGQVDPITITSMTVNYNATAFISGVNSRLIVTALTNNGLFIIPTGNTNATLPATIGGSGQVIDSRTALGNPLDTFQRRGLTPQSVWYYDMPGGYQWTAPLTGFYNIIVAGPGGGGCVWVGDGGSTARYRCGMSGAIASRRLHIQAGRTMYVNVASGGPPQGAISVAQVNAPGANAGMVYSNSGDSTRVQTTWVGDDDPGSMPPAWNQRCMWISAQFGAGGWNDTNNPIVSETNDGITHIAGLVATAGAPGQGRSATLGTGLNRISAMSGRGGYFTERGGNGSVAIGYDVP